MNTSSLAICQQEYNGIIDEFRVEHSHWSRNVQAWLSLVETFKMLKYFHSVATPALLCHKEPARRIQSPLLGTPRWFFMAQGTGGFHARKGPIINALMP